MAEKKEPAASAAKGKGAAAKAKAADESAKTAKGASTAKASSSAAGAKPASGGSGTKGTARAKGAGSSSAKASAGGASVKSADNTSSASGAGAKAASGTAGAKSASASAKAGGSSAAGKTGGAGSSAKSGAGSSAKGGAYKPQATLKQKVVSLLVVVALVFALWGLSKALPKYFPDFQISEVLEEVLLGGASEKGQAEKGAETPAAGKSGASLSSINVQDEWLLPSCPGGEDHQQRTFTGYSLCYRETYEQAEWSAECLTREKLSAKASGRTDDFRTDPEITTGSATLADYKASGYDRGHLVPAADMAWSEQAMSESFYMSNMSPQAGSFNRGIWNNLEDQVRKWAKEFGTLYVVSGPILEKDEYPTIGANKVAVPEYYYKVLLAHTDDDRWSAIGFILANEKSDASFLSFAVPVDEVERRCNIDFFASLDDADEAILESSFDPAFWNLK